jgi:ubiquinone/menaquinone biosynthesis C-methylase UbiE
MEKQPAAVAKYPTTQVVQPKMPKSYVDGEPPFGRFGSEEKAIKYLETLDDATFRGLSDLYTVMATEKGGWMFTDRLYEDNPRTPLDRVIYNSRSCRSVHDRKPLVREQLIRFIEEFRGPEEMKIYDIGSGPSDYSVEALAKLKSNGRVPPLGAHVTCIDNNTEALQRGQQLARNAGVGENIEYKRANIGHLLFKNGMANSDIVMAIGVICPFDDEIVLSLFRGVINNLKEGGKFYTCAMSPHPLKNVLDQAGWVLNYRSPEKLEALLKASGFEPEIYMDAHNLFVMGIGQKA